MDSVCIYLPKSTGYICVLISRIKSILKDSDSQKSLDTAKKKKKKLKEELYQKKYNSITISTTKSPNFLLGHSLSVLFMLTIKMSMHCVYCTNFLCL